MLRDRQAVKNFNFLIQFMSSDQVCTLDFYGQLSARMLTAPCINTYSDEYFLNGCIMAFLDVHICASMAVCMLFNHI